ARAPLALARLDDDPGTEHAVANVAMDELLLGGLEDVVVLGVRADRLEAAVALLPRPIVRVAEEDELELRRDEHAEARGRGALDLAAENPPRRLLDRAMVLVLDVTEDERRLVEPG